MYMTGHMLHRKRRKKAQSTWESMQLQMMGDLIRQNIIIYRKKIIKFGLVVLPRVRTISFFRMRQL